MFDPKSPFNDARLSEISADPADHDHLDAWLAHLQGYEKIQRGPYQSTHGLKHDGWSAQHPKQTRRVAVPNYTGDYNQLMPLLFETHARLLAGGCIDCFAEIYNEKEIGWILRKPSCVTISGPDSKNRWQTVWFDEVPEELLVTQHFEPTVAIAAAIITALEGQRAALAQSNICDFAPLRAQGN